MRIVSVIESPERVLCGALMLGGHYDAVVREVRDSDFVDPQARKVFETIGEQVRKGEPCDAVTVAERLPNDWHLSIMQMSEAALDLVGSIGESLHFARMVQRGARRRQIRELLEESLTRIDAGEDIDLIAEEVSQTADATYHHREITPSLSKLLMGSAESIQNAYNLQREQGFVGESYTLPEMDARLGGLYGTMLVVLGARTSVGKSTFAWQMALEAARNGSAVGIIDTEMGAIRCGVRIMAYYYGLNNTALRLGKEEVVKALWEKSGDTPIHNYPLHVECNTRDLYSIMGQIGRWKREFGIKFAVVDYLQKIDVPHVSSPFEARGVVTKELQRQSQQLDIPIVLVSQFNRSIDKENRPPVLSDLRESGNIEQDADLVIAMHGKLDADQFGNRDLEIHILKAKDARTGKLPFKFTLNGPTYHIEQAMPL